MGSGLQLVDADGNVNDTDADATLQVDTDFIRTLTFAEGQVEFLRDIGNVNEVPPANHTTLTYDDVNDRWVASRDFIDIQATGNFNQTQVNTHRVPAGSGGDPSNFILSNWADFTNFDAQGIEYIAADNAFQFNGEIAFNLLVALRGVNVLYVPRDTEGDPGPQAGFLNGFNLYLERRIPVSTDVNGNHTFDDADWTVVVSQLVGGIVSAVGVEPFDNLEYADTDITPGTQYRARLEVTSLGFAGDTDDFWSIETQPSAEMAFLGTFGSASGFTALEVDRSQQIENAFILYSEPDATDTELVPKWITSRIVEDFTLDTSIGGTEDQIFVSGQQAIDEGVIELPIRMGEGLESTNQFRYLTAFNAFQYAVPRNTPILFTLSDIDLEITNYFTGGQDTRIGMSVRLQESRNNGRTFEDTTVVESSVHLLNNSQNSGFTDTDAGTTLVTLTGGSGTVTPLSLIHISEPTRPY